MEHLSTVVVASILIGFTVLPRLLQFRALEKKAREKLSKVAGTDLATPVAMHPQIDALNCIGCGACVKACPEEGVLGLIGGKATLIQGSKCVGHGFCVESCPVGAIRLGFGAAGRSANLPHVEENLETNVAGIYIAGELGGMGLIRNAVNQGVKAVEDIAQKTRAAEKTAVGADPLDVLIVGAGPAGMAAGLTAMKHKLKYRILEQEGIGGTILQYPRRKIVMTSPVELPLYGRLKLTETSKEALLETWNNIIERTGLQIHTQHKVSEIRSMENGFRVFTGKGEHDTKHVVLALGRRGTPRKLGVAGEELSKVAYRLMEAESYQNCKVLVVGGGDSAVEAAIALGAQTGNEVTISYRKGEFARIKDRNEKRLKEMIDAGMVKTLFHSNVTQIKQESVELAVPEGKTEFGNDYVFVFAGGELPYDFLKKIGIALNSQAC